LDEERISIVAVIRQAFSGVLLPDENNIVMHDCDECAGVRRAFAGRHWKELDRDFVSHYQNSLFLFTPQAFCFYLPAFMITALYDDQSLLRPITMHCLSAAKPDDPDPPPGSDAIAERICNLNMAQQSAIILFLRYMQQNCDEPETEIEDARYALESYWDKTNKE